MQPKFNIDAKTKGKDIHIELEGDFDGASALELIFFMSKYFANNYKVFINTDLLCSIESFGINVFRYNIGPLIKYRKNYEFIGESAPVFKNCWPKNTISDHVTRSEKLRFQSNSFFVH
ncbi:MAG: hypothetical protein KKC46_01175 [Proteobacteria bacterium]|nr:hypothetical protein [Pseudomonadota bacterium]